MKIWCVKISFVGGYVPTEAFKNPLEQRFRELESE